MCIYIGYLGGMFAPHQLQIPVELWTEGVIHHYYQHQHHRRYAFICCSQNTFAFIWVLESVQNTKPVNEQIPSRMGPVHPLLV